MGGQGSLPLSYKTKVELRWRFRQKCEQTVNFSKNQRSRQNPPGFFGQKARRGGGVCLMIPFLCCDGVGSMRRGGIYAARKTVRALSIYGGTCRIFCIVGRAISPAAHIIKILKNHRFGGVKTPPYKPGKMSVLPGNPAQGIPLPGGIYASPTNKVSVYTSRKPGNAVNVHGPHVCGPQTLRHYSLPGRYGVSLIL